MKLSLTPLLILLFIAIKSFSQQTKEIVEETGQKYSKEKKIYNVLKDNRAIKHGPYEQYRNDKLAVTGFYKMDRKDSVWQRYDSKGLTVSKRTYTENKRTGIWEFYKADGTTAWQYDFSNKSIQNQPDELPLYLYQSENGEFIKDKADREPVWLRSKYEWISYLNMTLRYPMKAIDENKQGTVLVEILVDENGYAIDYSVPKSIFKELDEESLRVVKTFQPEFLPAEKNGKKVKTKIQIPIVFRMEN